MTLEHDIFLSHNRADKDWVRQLAEQIESETIDGGESSRPLKVWFDEWDIDSGENIVSHISKGLKTSQFAAAILSPEYLAAPFPELEWTHLVASDPTNKSRRLIPILRRDRSLVGDARIDLPAPFLTLKYIDFRDDSKFIPRFQDLIRRMRGLPPERGQKRSPLAGRSRIVQRSVLPTFQPTEDAWEPDRVSDVIVANLLPVLSIPKLVYSGPTECRTAKEVVTLAPKSPGFLVRSKRIFTFANLPSSPLNAAISEDKVVKEATSDWLLNEDRSRWLVELLNRCLARHLFTLPLTLDTKGRYFFRPGEDGSNRVITLDGGRPREVAAKKSFGQDVATSFWVHYGLRAGFRRIGPRFFIEVEPTYVFTADGKNPLGGKKAGKLSIQWSGMQRNQDVLRNISFWARILGKSFTKFTIDTGGEGIICDSTLAIAKMPVGIADDHIRIKSLIDQKVDDLDKAAADLNNSGIENFTEIEEGDTENDDDDATP